MLRSGVVPLGRAANFSHAGWTSVLARLPWLAYRAWRYFAQVDRFAPDLAVVIDSPGLHGPLVDRLRARGIAVAWVAPPQLWAWKSRSGRRLQGLPVYPAHHFEVAPLEKTGANAFWWGFPGVRPVPAQLRPEATVLALLPGSRPAWRRRHRELFARAATLARLPLKTVLVHPEHSGTENGLACGRPEEVLPKAALALCLPGTATLETALWAVPTVVAARPGRLDGLLAQRYLSDGFRALPNRILERGVFPEIYGSEASAEVLARALVDLFARRGRVVADLADLAGRLGDPSAADRIAAHILETSRQP